MAGDEPLDGQENWGEEGGPLSEQPLPGPPSGGPPGAAERILPGENQVLCTSSIAGRKLFEVLGFIAPEIFYITT